MNFNPDPNKQTQELIVSHKKKTSHPPLNFKSHFAKPVQFQKHLGVYLDGKLDFRKSVYYVNYKIIFQELH